MDTFSKSDPQIFIYMKGGKVKDWKFMGKTEIIWNNLNPKFSKSLIVGELKKKTKYKISFKTLQFYSKKKIITLRLCRR